VLFGSSFWVDSSDCWFFKIFEITRITILLLWWFVKNWNKSFGSTPHWSVSPFSNWDIWVSIQTCQYVLMQLCQCHLQLERVRELSPFYLCYFFLSKNFNRIRKDASIFHLMSGSSQKLSYFSTLTPSGHTSHHRGWLILGYWLLT